MSTAGGFLAANVIGGIAGQVKDLFGNAFADARGTGLLMAQTQVEPRKPRMSSPWAWRKVWKQSQTP